MSESRRKLKSERQTREKLQASSQTYNSRPLRFNVHQKEAYILNE